MENKTICTECPERCVLTPQDKNCLKDARWLDRPKAWCRQCANEEFHSHCIEHTEFKGTWEEIATDFYLEYQLHAERIKQLKEERK